MNGDYEPAVGKYTVRIENLSLSVFMRDNFFSVNANIPKNKVEELDVIHFHVTYEVFFADGNPVTVTTEKGTNSYDNKIISFRPSAST